MKSELKRKNANNFISKKSVQPDLKSTKVRNSHVINKQQNYAYVDLMNMPSRAFTPVQLSKICSDNRNHYNRILDIAKLNKRETYIVAPMFLHYHAFGNPVDPHIRAGVYRLSDQVRIGVADLTFKQWEQGMSAKEYNHVK